MQRNKKTFHSGKLCHQPDLRLLCRLKKKNKKTELKEAFLSLPEEEAFKYFTIFRNGLSGTIGKNLINMEFPLHTEEEGGTQNFLLKLRDSELKDDG